MREGVGYAVGLGCLAVAAMAFAQERRQSSPVSRPSPDSQ
jgi:hypothetical protein